MPEHLPELRSLEIALQELDDPINTLLPTPLREPKPAARCSEAKQTNLALYIATDYVSEKGAGIGFIQQAECAAGKDVIPLLRRTCRLSRHCLVQNHLGTEARVQMFAIASALVMAQSTVRRGIPGNGSIQKIVIFCGSPGLVQNVRYHLELLNEGDIGMEHLPEKLRENIKIIRSQTFADIGDRLKFQKIMAKANQLRKLGFKIEIEVPAVRWKVQQMARKVAKKKPRGRSRGLYVMQKRLDRKLKDIPKDSHLSEPQIPKEGMKVDSGSKGQGPSEPGQSDESLIVTAPPWTANLPLRPITPQITGDREHTRTDDFELRQDEWILVDPDDL